MGEQFKKSLNGAIWGIVFLVPMVFSFWAWSESADNMPIKTQAINYFSVEYNQARTKFLKSSRTANASIESFKNPYLGPEGEPLFTDVALVGPRNAKTVLVLVSGTHGVEGFAGSGIQSGLLREGVASWLKPDMSIVMIHALNPYGFSHQRRFNEDNIDLNRNFVDHSISYPPNPGYEELADVIAPKAISFLANTKARLRLLWYLLINGKLKLKEAISRGQYTHPQGLFYGGHSEAWSNRTIRTIANSYLANVEQVVIVDFHTGLGPFGNAEVILNEKKDSPAYERAVKWWGDGVKTTSGGESVSVHPQGTLKLALPKMLPHAGVTAVSLEFGTLSRRDVFWALRAENWLHHYGDKEQPDMKRIKVELLVAFYPNGDDWKKRVWKQGKEVVEQAIASM